MPAPSASKPLAGNSGVAVDLPLQGLPHILDAGGLCKLHDAFHRQQSAVCPGAAGCSS